MIRARPKTNVPYWVMREQLEREMKAEREQAAHLSLNSNSNREESFRLMAPHSDGSLAASASSSELATAYNVNALEAAHRSANFNVNAWGDPERMRQIEGRLDERHWECVPEYYQTKYPRPMFESPTPKKKGPQKEENAAAVMKKKSDKNLKALALIEGILKNHHFSCDERVHLSTMFTRNFGAEKHAGLKLMYIDMRKFQGIMHATFGITNERIIEGLYRAFDYAGNNIITEPEWVRGLSIFLRGTFEEQLEFVWTIYDINGDGLLSREEMYAFLEDSIVNTKGDDNDTEEAVKDLVELLFRKLDLNHDGKVDREDFNRSVCEDHLLLECCGPCFPSQRHVDVFEAVFADEITFKPI